MTDKRASPGPIPDGMGVCGVDEAGRGPLAGNVVAAAVILDPARPIVGLRDSKKLSARTRERLAVLIRAQALDFSIGQCSAAEIDKLNILQASLEAMRRAVAGLRHRPAIAHVDGNQAPALNCPVRTIIGGDDSDQAIAAASILAKTVRDAQMLILHERYPQFGFDRHKGYPTAAHREALQAHGPCPDHRRSFAPVAAVLANRADPRG